MSGDVWKQDESKMDIVRVHDKGGSSLKMQIVGGQVYNTFYDPQRIADVKFFKLREDDIFFPGFPRTGTNWTFERMSMLLRGKAETVPRNKTKDMIEVTSSEEWDKEPSPRILCTHMCLSDAPKQLAVKKCKVIYTIRDPKDVAVAAYRYYHDVCYTDYDGEFKDFLYLFMDGKVGFRGLFTHIRAAEMFFDDHPDTPAYVHIYEEALKNPLKSTQELSDFLDLPRNDALCQAIVEKCSIAKMKIDKEKYIYNCDRNFLFRKGIAGDWRNYFTEEMLEDYYRVYEEKMAGSRFYHLYSRDKDV